MSVASVTPNTVTGSTSTDSVPNPNQTLNQNDFLQLLVTQMENQDPLNPESDTDMASQMAQFTSLQQSSAMSGSLSMIQANSLVGTTATVQVGTDAPVTGVVQSVDMSSGTPQIVINGADYSLSQLLSIAPTASSNTTNTSNTSNSTTPSTPSTATGAQNNP